MSFDPRLTNDLSKVRALIGDTDPANQKLDDDTISAFLLLEGNYKKAAARCAQVIAAKYADRPTARGLHIQSENNQLYLHYSDLARRLWAQAATADSIYKVDLKTGPSFSRGMHDNKD